MSTLPSTINSRLGPCDRERQRETEGKQIVAATTAVLYHCGSYYILRFSAQLCLIQDGLISFREVPHFTGFNHCHTLLKTCSQNNQQPKQEAMSIEAVCSMLFLYFRECAVHDMHMNSQSMLYTHHSIVVLTYMHITYII